MSLISYIWFFMSAAAACCLCWFSLMVLCFLTCVVISDNGSDADFLWKFVGIFWSLLRSTAFFFCFLLSSVSSVSPKRRGGGTSSEILHSGFVVVEYTHFYEQKSKLIFWLCFQGRNFPLCNITGFISFSVLLCDYILLCTNFW